MLNNFEADWKSVSHFLRLLAPKFIYGNFLATPGEKKGFLFYKSLIRVWLLWDIELWLNFVLPPKLPEAFRI